MYYYAQLDDHDVIIEIVKSQAPIDGPRMILLTQEDLQKEWIQNGSHYNKENNFFYMLPESQKPGFPEVTNEDIAHTTLYVTAMMDVLIQQGGMSQTPVQEAKIMAFAAPLGADNIDEPHSRRYDFWRFSYFANHTNAFTLERLVAGGVITQDELEQIVNERIAEYGI